MREWPLRRWIVSAGVAVVSAAVIGVPTGIVSTPLYTRMTPVLWWNYPVWAASSLLEGLLLATYVRTAAKPQSAPAAGRAVSLGVLSVLAVGCPVCNKVVVLAVGVSGALSYWAPAQPILAVLSLALLVHALVRRVRAENACPLPARAASG